MSKKNKNIFGGRRKRKAKNHNFVMPSDEELAKRQAEAIKEEEEFKSGKLTQQQIKNKAEAKKIAEERPEWEKKEMEEKSEACKRGWETRRREGTDKKAKLKPITPLIQWLTTKETMALAQTSRTTMYKQIKEGKFPKPVKIGKKSLWIKSEINDWIKEQQRTLTEYQQ